MIIDLIFLFLIVLSVFKGLRNGFVVAVFSLLGIIVGLAAAMKLSTLVASWLQQSTHIAAAWLPFLSFILIMIAVVVLVRLGAIFLQSILEMTMLGWMNKLTGILLYALLYLTILSVLLFYTEKLHWYKADTFIASKTFPYIQPIGPKAINLFGKLIPACQGMFEELSQYFAALNDRIK